MSRGTVIKRGSKWSVVLDLGTDPTTGKRVREWHSGFPSKDAAEKERTRLLRQMDTGAHVRKVELTVAEFLTGEWLPAVEPTIRPGTFEQYRRSVKVYLVPRIGRIELQQLTPADIQRTMSSLLKDGKTQSEGGLATKTVRNHYGVIHKALDDAVRWGYLPRNVADAVDPPRWERDEPDVWTPGQLATFLGSVSEDRLFAAWVLSATTGLRRGELLGLRWKDVELDSDRPHIVVRQALKVVEYEPVFGPVKSKSGKRKLSLGPEAVAALKRHKADQAEERLAFGPDWQNDDGLVFVREDGTLIHPQRFSKWFEYRVRDAGLPKIRLHDVRHSYATALLEARVPVKVVSERLGHSTTQITQDLYQHVLEGMDEEAAHTGEAVIFGTGT